MSGSSFTNVFGGTVVRPSNPSYLALTLDADTTLVWPIETTEGQPVAAAQIDVTPTAASLSVAMPPATTGSTGVVTMITNVGSDTFYVKDNTGALITTVPTTVSYVISLTDNTTTAGVWRAYQLASTTSSATAASLAGAGLEAYTTRLRVNFTISELSSNTNLDQSYRAQFLVWTAASGTLQLADAATLGDGWFCGVSNEGSDAVTITTTGGDLINGSPTLIMEPGNSGIVVCSGTGFSSYGALIGPLSILNGGTGASDSSTALTNLGGTSIGKSIFTAPNAAAVVALLGLSSSLLTTSTISTDQSFSSSASNTVFICTAGLTITLPLTTSLTNAFNFQVYASGGDVTLSPQVTDNIQGGSTGASYVIPQGGVGELVTDASGHWWIVFGPAITGTDITATGDITAAGNLVAQTNALISGYLIPTTRVSTSGAYQVVMIGDLAGAALPTDAQGDVGVGYEALNHSNVSNGTVTGGSRSTAVGWKSQFTAAGNTAIFNTAVGASSLYGNMDGGSNTAIGAGAMQNGTQSSATSAGRDALRNGQQSYSVAVGQSALYGYEADQTISVGTANTAIGYQAMVAVNLTAGSYNLAAGFQSMVAVVDGSYNVALGPQSLHALTSGSTNTVVGYQAGYSLTTTNSSVFVGEAAGFSVTSGLGNVLIGRHAGYGVTTGVANTFVGNAVGSTGTITGSNNILIGTSGSVVLPTGATSNYFAIAGGATNIITATNINGTPVVDIPGGSFSVASVPVKGAYSATSGSLGGSPVADGNTITINVAVTGAAFGMTAVCSPNTFPGAGFMWGAYVSGADQVTVALTAAVAATPAASTYLVRVFP